MRAQTLALALAISGAFPACQKKGPPASGRPAASAIDETAYQKKISSPEGLRALSPEEKARYNREIADSLFLTFIQGHAEPMLTAIETATPDFGMIPFDPNIRSDRGESLLTASVKAGSKVLVEMFLRHGTDPSLKDASGKTALELAKEKKRDDLVALLSRVNRSCGSAARTLNNIQRR